MLEHQELSELCKWPATAKYASFLALTVSNSSLFTPALLRTHSFVFVASIASCRGKKASPYLITERRVPKLIPVLGSQSAGDMSHKPDGRLPLLSARSAVTLQPLRGLLPVLLLGEQRCNGCDGCEQFA